MGWGDSGDVLSVAPLQGCYKRRCCPFALADEFKRTHQTAHHTVQKSVCFDCECKQLGFAPPFRLENFPDSVCALRRLPKCSKVMRADQVRGGCIHLRHVQRLANVPAIKTVRRAAYRLVVNPVAVSAATGVKAGMKMRVSHREMLDRNVCRQIHVQSAL